MESCIYCGDETRLPGQDLPVCLRCSRSRNTGERLTLAISRCLLEETLHGPDQGQGGLQSEERVRLLFDRLRAAYAVRRAATTEYKSLRDNSTGVRDRHDADFALHQCAIRQQIAIEDYLRALKEFSDFVIRDRRASGE